MRSKRDCVTCSVTQLDANSCFKVLIPFMSTIWTHLIQSDLCFSRGSIKIKNFFDFSFLIIFNPTPLTSKLTQVQVIDILPGSSEGSLLFFHQGSTHCSATRWGFLICFWKTHSILAVLCQASTAAGRTDSRARLLL